MCIGVGQGIAALIERVQAASETCGRPPRRKAGSVVAAEQGDHAALHFDPVGREDAGFVADVARFQRDRVAAPAQPLQRDLGVVNQGDHDLAVLRA